MKPRTSPLTPFLLTLLALLGYQSAFAQDEAAKDRPSLEERLDLIMERFPQADTNKDGTLTREEGAAFMKQRRAEMEARKERTRPPEPTHADVKYGDHELQAFDIWLAEPKEEGGKTPLCLFVHGGGFRGGDKSGVSGPVIQRFLNEGISFASMNYRLSNGGEFPYPIAMEDSAYGLQFIRSKAEEWNLDPTKVVSHGGSAGAGISLWLAFHDDLANPDAEDPVKHQSTRLLAAATMNGQSTYDLRTYREWFGVPDLVQHDALVDFYAMKEGETAETPRVAALAEQASAITHLTEDDPPVYMLYGRPNTPVTKETDQGTWVHHALLGLKLQEAMAEFGIECIVTAPELEAEDPYGDLHSFLIEKLTK